MNSSTFLLMVFLIAMQSSCSIIPKFIFLKFHKVGSTSLQELFLQIDARYTSWWDNKNLRCASNPFDHRILDLYLKHGRNIKKCLQAQYHPDELMYVTILRDPLDRYYSSLRFFGQQLRERIKNEIPSDLIPNALEALRKIRTDKAHQLTIHEITDLLNATNERYSRNKKFSPIHIQHPYQIVFRKSLSGPVDTPQMLQASITNLRNDFDVVGTTENISSLFVLIANISGTSIENTCNKFIIRRSTMCSLDEKTKICQRVQAYRPFRDLISTEVRRLLENYFDGEIQLYNEAISMHSEQLFQTTGMSVLKAAQLWNKTCYGRQRKRLMGKGEDLSKKLQASIAAQN